MKRVLVFDVNETLLDLSALDPHFQRVFGDATVRVEWFQTMLQSAFLTTITGPYRPFGEHFRAALAITALRRGLRKPRRRARDPGGGPHAAGIRGCSAGTRTVAFGRLPARGADELDDGSRGGSARKRGSRGSLREGFVCRQREAAEAGPGGLRQRGARARGADSRNPHGGRARVGRAGSHAGGLRRGLCGKAWRGVEPTSRPAGHRRARSWSDRGARHRGRPLELEVAR